MSAVQAVILGIMLVWTPCVALLAFLLWRDRIGLGDRRDNRAGGERKLQLDDPPFQAGVE